MTHDKTQKLLIPVKQNDAGGVVVDSRGRNVWQWKDEQLDSTSVVLQRLDNAALELESTRKTPIAKDEKEAKGKRAGTARGKPRDTLSMTVEVDEGGGFDPYNKG